MSKSAENGRKFPGLSARTIRIVSLVLIVITIVALGAVAFYTERGIVASRDWVIHTYQVRTELNDLQLELMRARADETAYLFAQKHTRLPEAEQQGEQARHTAAGLTRLTRDNPRQQERLRDLQPLLDNVASLLKAAPGQQNDRVRMSPSQKKRQDEISASSAQIDNIVDSMQAEEHRLLAERLTSWNYLFRRNVIMLATAFGVVAFMLAYNFWLMIKEISRAKDRERHIQENAESYRLMSARILELQDTERRRVARELHDSVGQVLAGLKINLSQLEAGNRLDARSLLKQTIELTDSTLQEVRTLSHLLHPPLLEELGFQSAALWYVDEYGKRSQLKVELHIEDPIERLPRPVEVALFRVLQESLTNVHRHASARSIDIRFACRDGKIHLTIADDGKGIPPDVLASFRGGAAPGIGLAGMRERLAEFGGELLVHSSSAGSVVESIIPAQLSLARKKAA